MHRSLTGFTLLAVSALTPAFTAAALCQTPAELIATPAVQQAMQTIKASEPHYIDEQIRICQIAALDRPSKRPAHRPLTSQMTLISRTCHQRPYLLNLSS